MRYHLDTIPLWEAMELTGACALCTLRSKTEHMLVDRYLGGSVMEPDTRIQVNAKGFCARHHKMLYAKENRLGHALMLQSRMNSVRREVEAAFDMADISKGNSLFKRKAGGGAAAALKLSQMHDHCVLCESLDETMARYAYTLLHLFKSDEHFRDTFKRSRGLCLKDVPLVLGMAEDTLSGQILADFIFVLREKTLETLDKNKQDIDWFTLKHDYRNADEPWKDSRDAPARAVNYLRGWSLGDDPWPRPGTAGKK